MGIHTFAAIYIGSYEVSLKIFEFSSKKKIRGIDYVRSRIEIGKDVYVKKSIGYEMVDALCDTLVKFMQIVREYRVDCCEIYAASALRDAQNELFVLDQIKMRTGLKVHILSNSEHRFVSYRSVAMRTEFEPMIQKGAAVVDVGGSGLQITIFSKGNVITTQHLNLGAIRMREKLLKKSSSLMQYEQQIEEIVVKELAGFKTLYLQDVKIEYLMLIGDYITEIIRKMEREQGEDTVNIKKFIRYIEKIEKMNLEEMSEEFGLANENDALVVPHMLTFKCMAEQIGANLLWAPGAIVSDGIACAYAEKHRLYKTPHDFDADILSAANSLAMRNKSYAPHIQALTEMSALIFDAMKKIHGLGKRERLLLQVSAILHDCGKYISFASAATCSYHIINSSEIMGLSHREREIVANTVLYHTLSLAPYEEISGRILEEDYVTVAKLSAILRLANAMDRSHKQKFKNVRAAIREKQLVITIETAEDIALEKAQFDAKTAYFERVFSVKPVIKEKRVYN